MRILITNNTLANRAGSELYVRDLALALLRLGHEPIAYSTILGEVAEELRRSTVQVVDDLSELGVEPHVIHAQHHLDAMTALLRFPDVPAVFMCHGWTPWQERPVEYPSIVRYLAVDEPCRERLLATPGIAPEMVEVIHNFVDLSRFHARGPLPEAPRSALVFSNHANDHTYVNPIRAACRRMGIEKLDIAGIRSGNPVADPGSMLGDYDVVFAKARCALEAMAVGCAVIVVDTTGMGGMVTTRNMKEMRPLNFGFRTMQSRRITEETVSEALNRYDRTDAALVSEWIRQDAAMPKAIQRILEVYDFAISVSAGQTLAAKPSRLELQLRAGSSYLRSLAPRMKAIDEAEGRARHAASSLEVAEARAARAEAQLEEVRRDAESLQQRLED